MGGLAGTVTAARLIRMRERLGWSQEKLADEVGVNQTTVSRWESGVRPIRRPVAVTLERIADRENVKL